VQNKLVVFQLNSRALVRAGEKEIKIVFKKRCRNALNPQKNE
jgi:hypothetical protein